MPKHASKHTSGGGHGMKEGKRVYGQKHERKYWGRVGRKSFRVWLRAHGKDAD